MKFALKPLAALNGFVLAALLATAGTSAMAQAAPAAPTGGPAATGWHGGMYGNRMMGQRDPAKMQAWMAKRQAALKARLKITPDQEGAWTAFTAAMQPPVRDINAWQAQRAEMQKLSTPERIDKMRALRTQRMTEMNALMDKHGDATKAFYAALSPEQQKTFDAEHQRFGQAGNRGRHEGRMHHRY